MFIQDGMREYAARGALRLHTPGHKGELSPLDITELTDGSFPTEAVAKAQAFIAAHYKARHARILCCGSSQGVKAAVYFAACNAVVDINSHRSVFDGFTLARTKYVAAGERGSVFPITVEQIKKSLAPDTGAVVVTSPTYFGYCADIDGIGEFCKKRGLKFIVDGAHGAHFGASPLLPPMFTDKCDISDLSAHKTLRTLTQGAVLVDNLSDDDGEKLSRAVDLMGTTSPSYPLCASVENGVAMAENQAEAYAALYEPVRELKSAYGFLDNDDFTRLVLDCRAVGADSRKLNGELARLGIMSELVTDNYIVFLLTAADSPIAVQKLGAALRRCVTK